jgi:hypothetical protein
VIRSRYLDLELERKLASKQANGPDSGGKREGFRDVRMGMPYLTGKVKQASRHEVRKGRERRKKKEKVGKEENASHRFATGLYCLKREPKIQIFQTVIVAVDIPISILVIHFHLKGKLVRRGCCGFEPQ